MSRLRAVAVACMLSSGCTILPGLGQGSGEPGGTACRTRLPGQVLRNLWIASDRELLPGQEVAAGDSLRMSLAFLNPMIMPPSPEQVDGCATWSAEGPEGVQVSPLSGVLRVPADTPHGARVTVRADVRRGRRIVETEVLVWRREENPLVGTWRERARVACPDGAEVSAGGIPIREWVLRADGTFSVTWSPFESYRDYWGRYEVDVAAGRLALTIQGGNYIPRDVDSEGTFEVATDGSILLRDLWLGSPLGDRPVTECGHRFSR